MGDGVSQPPQWHSLVATWNQLHQISYVTGFSSTSVKTTELFWDHFEHLGAAKRLGFWFILGAASLPVSIFSIFG